MPGMRAVAYVAALILAAVLFIALLYVARSQTQNGPTAIASPAASETATATATASATATPAQTAATPTPVATASVAKSSSPSRTVVYCGTLGPSDVQSGQGSGSDTLRSPRNE